MSGGETIALSLISHTNAGKTTLARTLLGREVGEVRDAPHVTREASAHTLIETPAGDALLLWDTPGFGDSARLARRLRQQGNPIGWFLSQVWDRFRDPAFWLSQLAVRNVREQADVVLYLVNAAEVPAEAGYLGPEMDILEWIGRPVIVLLNQTGAPRPPADEAADEECWRQALAGRSLVRSLLTLDAFTRCWVQEGLLLAEVGKVLSGERQAAVGRLASAWRARREAQFAEAMAVLAASLARAVSDSEALSEGRLKGALRDLGRAIGVSRATGDDEQTRALAALGARLDADLLTTLDRLIALHQLAGQASADLRERLARTVQRQAPVNESTAALLGGAVSGALGGLGADLATGGLTLGGGLLTGAVLGALSAAGLARGVNVARGRLGASLRWDDAFLIALAGSLLLRYLAVAHYGRGRGEWREAEYPVFWPPLVDEVVLLQRSALLAACTGRDTLSGEALARRLQPLLSEMARTLLKRIHPAARATLSAGGANGAAQDRIA